MEIDRHILLLQFQQPTTTLIDCAGVTVIVFSEYPPPKPGTFWKKYSTSCCFKTRACAQQK